MFWAFWVLDKTVIPSGIPWILLLKGRHPKFFTPLSKSICNGRDIFTLISKKYRFVLKKIKIFEAEINVTQLNLYLWIFLNFTNHYKMKYKYFYMVTDGTRIWNRVSAAVPYVVISVDMTKFAIFFKLVQQTTFSILP